MSESKYKYNVNTLAEDLDIQPAAVRTKLRNREVKKNKDGEYGWDNQPEYLKVKALWDKKAKKPVAKKAAKKRAAEPRREAAA